MKWIKTLEKFKTDSSEKINKEEDEDVTVVSTTEEEEKQEISDSYVDEEGIVHIEDWQQY
jgi:hypothetical protein